MAYELIITEKPQAAKKIADALANGKAIKKSINKIPYYEITHGNKDIVVASAVGHLYTIIEKNKDGWKYPVFEVEWKPISQVNKKASYSSKYITALKKLSKDADEFTVACDYDIEGEVIGYNVIKHICKQKDAKRMKFSTLTKNDLQKAYDNVLPSLDWGQANAGLTRHVLDWYYGINLSRALTLAVKSTGSFKILSSGRVQGPALKIIVDKEKEIKSFKPKKFWQVFLDGKVKSNLISAVHEKDKFWEKEEADKVIENTKGKEGKISSIEKSQFSQKAPVPFDLTTLQTEAYRTLRIMPKATLEIAQELYIDGLISYPRTSSQKLPKEINYKKILNDLGKNKAYAELAKKTLKTRLVPNNGKKDDPAHPAIYPTGIMANLEGRKARLYDLIVKRFMATFGEDAVRETITLKIDVNKEIFVAKGTRTIKKGWHELYEGYVNIEEKEMPDAEKDDKVDVKKITIKEDETKPPKRYTAASIIKELEKRNLGTKATRANIIEALYDRGYIKDKAIEATPLGINICETLEKYCPEIVDEELTRHFEIEMDKIRSKEKQPDDVLEEAKETLKKILEHFKQNEKPIGEEILKSLNKTRDEMNYIGKCPVCKTGNLEIKRGKYGRFIACSNYPECKTTYKLPASGMIKGTDKLCEHCNYPLVEIIRKGKRPQLVCINPNCPGKESASRDINNEKNEIKNNVVEKKCPKCGKPLVLRKSIYGEFLGCSGYPKCKYTERLKDGPLKEDFKEK